MFACVGSRPNKRWRIVVFMSTAECAELSMESMRLVCVFFVCVCSTLLSILSWYTCGAVYTVKNTHTFLVKTHSE